MKKLEWLPPALNDLRRLQAFIKKENPRAALQALQKIKASTAVLKEFPDMGVLQDDRLHRELYAPFGRSAYVIRYRVDMLGNVLIVKVWYSRENRSH